MSTTPHRDAPRRALPTVVTDLIAVLEQGCELVESLPTGAYTAVTPSLTGSSFGAHYRHHLDHLRLLIEGIETGEIDYDRRIRRTALETDPSLAVTYTRELIGHLTVIDEAALHRPVCVLQASSTESARDALASTLGRELAFLLSHSIHHYAIMAILVRAGGLEVPANLGVMPSTLVYRDQH